MDLTGKVCLVTGGTRGIGAATAIALAEQGASAAIVARHDDDSANETKRRIRALNQRCEFLRADCAKPAECVRCVEQATAKLGSVDILVHAAGGPVNGGLLEVTPEDWLRAFDLHVHAIFHLCRAAIPQMQKKKQGAIILVASVAGLRALKTNIAYQSAKGAIPHLARALAREFADDNVRVNCVAPGVISTRFHAQMGPEKRKVLLEERIPLHREGNATEVAALVISLIKNDYITGETVSIDGGLTMRIA